LTTASYWRPSGKNIHRFPHKKDFEAAKIDPDEWGVKPNPGMEVAMKDRDRLEYMAYRTDRDIVREKAKPPEKDKDDKGKPPFVDRVLNKALEHLRKEIGKGPVAPVKRNA
jgi:carboxyl-terminal processing protease